MNSPIFDFVSNYTKADISRFHMPGHKGQAFLGCEERDITEINGADVLYSPDGIIAQSERNATALFGTGHTFYSAEGSSLSIKAMLALAVSDVKQSRRPLILAARNVHKAFVYAAALLDFDMEWMYPTTVSHLCSCILTADDVKHALESADTLPDAVYLTSPDYLGQCSDLQGIAQVCHAHNIPLLVDNAHGAYSAFLSPSQHPISLGADMCCDSAHKTLPVLTGGAYLHLSDGAVKKYGTEKARQALSLFASTSPSYLILQSLDLCNRYLASGYAERLANCITRTKKLKATLAKIGYAPEQTEPLKLVIYAPKYGHSGASLAAHLHAHKVECEYADGEYLVLMITPELSETDFLRVEQAFASFPLNFWECPKGLPTHPPLRCEAVLSARQAMLSPYETVSLEQAAGRICACPTVSCPPAIPLVISGERIPEEAIPLFAHYGILSVAVLKQDEPSPSAP